MTLLYPIQLDNIPNIKQPHEDPMAATDPIQPAVSRLMGPSRRGLGNEYKTGSAGEYHPQIVPWLNANMFPGKIYYIFLILLKRVKS